MSHTFIGPLRKNPDLKDGDTIEVVGFTPDSWFSYEDAGVKVGTKWVVNKLSDGRMVILLGDGRRLTCSTILYKIVGAKVRFKDFMREKGL